MKIKTYLEPWKNTFREFLFHKLIICLLAVALIANGLFRRDNKTIVSPPEIQKQYWVSANKASDEYIEQMSLFFVTFIGNVTPANVEYFHKVFTKYLTPKAFGNFSESLEADKNYIIKNNISQSFAAKNVNIMTNNEVIVYGERQTYIPGDSNSEPKKEKITYHLKLVYKNWQLFIDNIEIERSGDKPRSAGVDNNESSGKGSANN